MREREKHRKRKKLRDEINLHVEEGLKLLEKSKSLLGEDDPVTARLEAAMDLLRNGAGQHRALCGERGYHRGVLARYRIFITTMVMSSAGLRPWRKASSA